MAYKCFHCHKTAVPGYSLCRMHLASSQQAAPTPPVPTTEPTAKPVQGFPGRILNHLREVAAGPCQDGNGECLMEDAKAALAWLQQPVQEGAAIDVERMLRETVPGGTSCDPQAICDDIRAWFARNTPAEPCVPKFGARDTCCSLGTAGCVVVHEGVTP